MKLLLYIYIKNPSYYINTVGLSGDSFDNALVKLNIFAKGIFY